MDSKYFVLEFKGISDWARAARIAMRSYAAEIEAFDPKLSTEIKDAAYRADREAHQQVLEKMNAA